MAESTLTDDRFRYSVAIPTKDRGATAFATALALRTQTVRPERVVVVDASSPPAELPADVRDALAEAGIELVLEHAKPSTSKQRNRGAELVDTPLLLLLDDDIELPADYAARLLEEWSQRGFASLSGALGAAAVDRRPTSLVSRVYRRALMLHYYDPKARRATYRHSQKLRYNDEQQSTAPMLIDTAATGACLYRTELVRKHRFSERFDGYVLGEDLDFAVRVAREAPILYVGSVSYVHKREPGEGGRSPDRWQHRGQREAYFRLRRIERTPQATAAFAVSIVGELLGATVDSVRERQPRHVRGYVEGLSEAIREIRKERAAQLMLKPMPYYRLNHAYRAARVAAARAEGRGGDWQGMRILGYHRVAPERDPLGFMPSDFRRHLEWALEQGLRPVRVDAALDLLAKPVEERLFAVTFDDGYHDNLEHALPILEDLAIPATIYVITGVLDRVATYGWYRRRPPRALTWEEIERIVAGGLVDVQAHTRTHPALTRLDDEDARSEIAGSKSDLDARLPYQVTTIAVPAGIYGAREVALAEEAGYRAVVTTNAGVNPGGTATRELRRTMLLTGDTFTDFRAKLDGVLDEPSRLERAVRSRRV